MQAKRMPHNGTIGIISPHSVAANAHAVERATLERLGFTIKLGDNIQKDTYGYAASAEERAADLNTLVSDNTVQMILFAGGYASGEFLPMIDYDNIRHNPKLFSSYSAGTHILNAIHAQTGLVTYYGIGTGQFWDLRHYDYTQFCSHFIEGYDVKQFVSDSKWITLCGGGCEGTLVGGYALAFGLMLSNQHFRYDTDRKYLLFLEDHEKFSNIGAISTYLAFIGQSTFMRNVVGLIFGHYSDNVPENLLHCLERFGNKYSIPVVYSDDFGHGSRHAILPIGINAKLDADNQCLFFYDIR